MVESRTSLNQTWSLYAQPWVGLVHAAKAVNRATLRSSSLFNLPTLVETTIKVVDSAPRWCFGITAVSAVRKAGLLHRASACFTAMPKPEAPSVNGPRTPPRVHVHHKSRNVDLTSYENYCIRLKTRAYI